MKKSLLGGMDADSALPKYVQLRELLASSIRGGHYAVGDKLCTEADLKSRYGLSTATVTRALAELERMGLVSRKKGAGTFVAALHAPVLKTRLPGRTMLICGMPVDHDVKRSSVNWFIMHELYSGMINSYDGRVRLQSYAGLDAHLAGLPADAASVLMVNPPDDAPAAARTRAVPYVVVRTGGVVGGALENTVTVDRLQGVYEGMVYLMEKLGHRSIAMVAPDMASPSMKHHRDRVAGYAIGLQAFGIPYEDKLVAAARGGLAESGREAMEELLRRGVRFSAVFVDTDIKALGVIEALRAAGKRVPDDVSVLGFDDVPGMDQCDPPLTTVRVPRYELGAAAVAMLARRVKDGGADVPGIVLHSRLVIRGSCAPAVVRR